jgi:hypothetical protein
VARVSEDADRVGAVEPELGGVAEGDAPDLAGPDLGEPDVVEAGPDGDADRETL